MGTARYDGLADEYAAFLETNAPYYELAAKLLRELLEAGSGRCIDLGCGTGRFIGVAADLGWDVTGVDLSADQLRLASGPELIQADATAVPLPDASFDAGYSTFTHTDIDDFAGLVAEARRLIRPGGRFVYIGNHPCFVGPVQAPPVLHPGYRRGGRWDAASAPGSTAGGWRMRLGSYVHVPLGEILEAFAGMRLVRAVEPDDGREYPSMIALAFDR
ncbi:MAG TPA: methyltransferase domain-containing protein [Gaiellaceae bacterium]|nr:methyltransferase domain-containing protein [Gaiellaceae bacterium]